MVRERPQARRISLQPQTIMSRRSRRRSFRPQAREEDDKPLLDRLEIYDESWDTDEVSGWTLAALPSIFENEAGNPYNVNLAN